MRINKYIASCGISSRRKAEQFVVDKRVKVNGKILDNLAYQVKAGDRVTIDDKLIELVEEDYYLMLNKPLGYVSTNEDKFAKKTIFDLIDIDSRLFSIGRLDKDSRGLILITNDGDIYNKLMHPRSEVYKKYQVKLDKKFDRKDVKYFSQGIDIGGYITNPAPIKIRGDREVEISIDEGKNRQIRRMFDALSYKVIDLKRTEIGQIKLGNLREGKYRELNKKELAYLKSL